MKSLCFFMFQPTPLTLRTTGAASAFLALLLTAFPTHATNVVNNPGFESGTTGWSAMGPVSLSASTTMPHSGSRSVFVQGRTDTWNGVAQSMLNILQPGTTYSISAWVRLASGANQQVKLTMKQTDGSGTGYPNIASVTATSTGWTQLVGTFPLTVSGTLTDLTLYMEGPDAGVSFYADDFVVEAPVTTPIGNIDATQLHQMVEGFGGAIVFYNNWVSAHPYKQEMYTNMFKGLNLGILRLGNWFTYQGTANFDPDTVDIVSNANRIMGRSVKIQMSSYSPPAFLKSNGDVNNGGTLATTNGGFAYTNFANYWYDSLLAYQSNGIVPTWVSIQNEPDWAASYQSCVFHPSEDTVNGTNYASYSKALDATYQRLTNMPAPPKLLAPEVLGIGYSDVQNYAATLNGNSFYGVAHHLYHGGSPDSADSFIGSLQGLTNVFPGKPKFQTEYGETDMIQTALLIHNSMTVEEASAYIFWSLVWPTGGSALVLQDNPWNSQSTWAYPHGYKLTPQYYAIKHFSYFIGYGYRRVSTPGNDPAARLSAYLSPDNSRLVAVLINPNAATASVTLTLNGFSFATSAVYQTAGTNAQVSQFASLGSAPGNLQWTLPSYSITTVVFDAPLVAGPASNPNPTNGASALAPSTTLSWLPGANATSHQVYFGFNSNAVAGSTTGSPESQGNFPNPSFSPASLPSSGRFYWRVDELAGTNVTAGPTWTFATAVDLSQAPQAAGRLSGNNSFFVSFDSHSGQSYRVERSASLSPPAWTPVADGLPGTDGVLQISDTNAPLPGTMFYRVLLLAP